MKRRLWTIIAMSLIAIGAVIGIVVGIVLSKAEKDIYASMVVSTSVENIDLNLDIISNPDYTMQAAVPVVINDNGRNSAIFDVSVSGLPNGVSTKIIAKSLSPNIAVAEVISHDGEVSTVRVEGKNGGLAQIEIVTISGMKTALVDVNVKIPAKAVEVKDGAHFGVLKPAAANAYTNLNLSDPAKYNFYAHKDDKTRAFTVTEKSLKFEIVERHNGIDISADGESLNIRIDAESYNSTGEAVTVNVTNVDFIDANKKPKVFVFENFGEMNSTEPLYDDPYTAAVNEKMIDLILNRHDSGKDRKSIGFEPSARSYISGTNGVTFGVARRNNDNTIFNIDGESFTAINLGLGTADIIMYPVVRIRRGSDERVIEFNLENDAAAQMKVVLPVRVRNEFRKAGDDKTETGKLEFVDYSGNKITELYVPQNVEENGTMTNFFAQFSLGAVNKLPVDYENEVEFRFVKFVGGGPPSTYVAARDYFHLYIDGNSVNGGVYNSKFSVEINATQFPGWWDLPDTTEFYLEARTKFNLTTGDRAVSSIRVIGFKAVSEINAIDTLNLVNNDEESEDLKIVFADGLINRYVWNKYNLNDNLIESDYKDYFTVTGGLSGDTASYKISVKEDFPQEYLYRDIKLTFNYPSASKQVVIKVYPIVTSMSLTVTSANGGYIYKAGEIEDSSGGRDLYAFVRIGAEYHINVNTFSARVDARAEIAGASVFDARTETLFGRENVLHVRLFAINEDVYGGLQTDFYITIVVVNPIMWAGFEKEEITLDKLGVERDLDVLTIGRGGLPPNTSNIFFEESNISERVKMSGEFVNGVSGFSLDSFKV
ncbi:MAG: hypothetical protein LBH47_00330, partial [Christensenellaceae bacterium]|nr:hypothetical protein [Christensenellaceae bacterium]